MDKISLLRKTKFGRLTQSVTEQYLRDDIKCGLNPCKLCISKNGPINSLNITEIFIPDDTFFESQHDLLQYCPDISGIICLQTVMNVMQSKNPQKYGELKELIESGYRGFYYFANEHFKGTHIVFFSKEYENIDGTKN